MTKNSGTINNIAGLKNVARLSTLIQRVNNRHIDLPGMGVFYGPAGFGKTKSSIYATITESAIAVQMKSVWTAKNLCLAILAEMGVRSKNTTPQLLEQICEHLAIMDVPLIIDEADFLVKKRIIEVVRDIYEGSGVPIILIGNEELPQKLQQWERFHSRIMSWVEAKPGDISDARQLAPLYAPGLQIDPDLLKKLVAISGGSIRRICVNLDLLREHALLNGVEDISIDTWDLKKFYTGEAPTIHRFNANRVA